MRFIIIGYLWAFLVYGLYFPNHIYSFLILLAFTVASTIIYEWIRGQRSTFIVWLLPLPFLYMIPLIVGKFESIQGTLNQVIFMSMFVLISYLLLKLKKEKEGDKKLQQVITIISWSIMLLSYAILLRLFSFHEFIMDLSESVSGLGERLGGFLQYPNAFATLLASMILYHLLTAIHEEEVKSFLKQATLLPGLFGLFLLTESRGAWLLFVLTYFLSLVLVKGERQLRFLVLSLFVGISGLLLYVSMTYTGSIKASILSVILLCLFSGLISFLRPSLWKSLNQNRYLEKVVPFVLPVVSILFGLDILFKGLAYRLLPVSLQNRFSLGTGTLTDRFYYWHDVWENLAAIGFIGRGGDGWMYLMYRIQSYPYLTSEIHSSVIDIFLETGLIGLLYIMVITIFASRNLWRNKSAAFPAFIFLILHSLLDFTFSYPVIILWLLLLYMTGSTINTKLEKKYTFLWILPAFLMMVVLLSSMLLSLKFMKAERSYQMGFETNIEETDSRFIFQAMERNPWQTNFPSVLVEHGFLQTKEAIHYLEQAIVYEPANAKLHYQLAEIYTEVGDTIKAEKHYDLVLVYDRYDTEKYE